jgi:hypothetical protein
MEQISSSKCRITERQWRKNAMTLAKKIGLFAASAAVLTLGTLAATPPASATPLIATQAAQATSAGRYNLGITLFFGNGESHDRDWHRDHDRDWHRDWRYDHHGYDDHGWRDGR